MFSRFNRYLLAGFLMVAPLAITGYIGYQIVIFVDAEVDKLLPPAWRGIPALGFIILVFALVLIGSITTGVIGRIIHATIDRILLLLPVPLIRTVYGTLRSMLDQIFADSSNAFREVVMIEYPRPGVWALGFVTGEAYSSCQVSDETLINVFVPTTPNPTSGFLLMVPAAQLKRVDLSVEDGIKLVVSSGIVQPDMQKETAKP